MNSVVILTATYNHPNELKKLYASLCEQLDANFTWLIVNDGSGEETEKAIDKIIVDDLINTYVINKRNGGKSAAINDGINSMTSNVEFFVIVDDDELLFPEAVQTIKDYVRKYKDTECGVIHFNRKNEKGETIANPKIEEDDFKSYQRFKSEGRYADGYLGYFMDKLGTHRFSIYKGEKYIAPSTLFMKVTNNCKLLWAKAALGQTEYLAGGITKQGRKLRVKNPQGMIEYCEDMQINGSNFKTRLIYSIQGYAYRSLCKNKKKNYSFIKVAVLPGLILGKTWRRKYLHD